MLSQFNGSFQPGILHNYAPQLTAFEYAADPNARGCETNSKPHSLLFVGGLGDGYSTVPYLNDITTALEAEKWSVFSVELTSSYKGWGLSNLDSDVDEIGKCVEYVKGYKSASEQEPGKIVIMGHSTGSQDVLHYLYSQNPGPEATTPRPPVDGAIMQAPVSDREAILNIVKSGNDQDTPAELTQIYNNLISMAKSEKTLGGKDVILPIWMVGKVYIPDTAVSATRFLSLASPDSPEAPGEDDLFSSDLTDARLQETFGMISSKGLLKKSLLVMPGGDDEYVAPWIDKEKLLERWKAATTKDSKNPHIWSTDSAIIVGAKHSPSGPNQAQPRKDLVSRVKAFLADIERQN
ncbi:dolichol-phosphate mannosyltransferase [Histoplasma capsulatum H143]|uniref:Dolichol-phosphate mannosyltransferase n=1 Tax=Ajellomyces capsulatus (strain H143) TaxID=544712 RepID=C6H1I5_AJECH|nr:dolichol-phosphate mannosyltransferase [Histoplasma capsulatum H143]